MHKKNIFILFFIVLYSFGQKNKELSLHVKQFEEIASLQQKQKKPVIVFLHTNWCKYCFAMKKNTFTNDDVIHKINTNYYFISLDAESKKDIIFNNHTFKYRPSGINTGVHELAIALTDNKLTYPSTIILSANNEIIFKTDSFISSKDLLIILDKITLRQ